MTTSLERIRQSIRGSLFAEVLGGEVLTCADGACELRIPITPTVQQYAGFVFGGVVAFIADLGCAWACASVGGANVTGQLNVHFLAPAVGDTLIVRGRAVRNGRRMSVGAADVFALVEGQERLVATATATLTPTPSPPS
ncbi:PaaI family thioesterase [Phenylobacterium sp.]|uniref:PaaI family thioesterase n=1 Tax=Phenylobacterium sp. TaxID=1871053 RepID=UPI0035B49599